MNTNNFYDKNNAINNKWWNRLIDPNEKENWSVPNIFLEAIWQRKDKIRDLNLMPIFVETGTDRGGTSEIMSHVFDEVHTVEKYVDETKQNIYNQIKISSPNITFHSGDSSSKLKEIATLVNNKPCVFLLDAHNGSESPLIQELKIIKELFNKNCVIMIDDCDDIGKGSWPKSMEELEGLITDINKDMKVFDTGMGRRIIICYCERT